jgi:hypothetical protein
MTPVSTSNHVRDNSAARRIYESMDIGDVDIDDVHEVANCRELTVRIKK